MQRIAQWICGQTGWRRHVLSFLAGALSVLSFAPLHFWPVMFVTIPALVWLLDGCYAGAGQMGSGRRSQFARFAWTGWWFGFGFLLVGLYWIGFAFLVEAEFFAFLLPFAVTLMPAGLALFFAAATALARVFWLPGVGRVLGLAISMTLTEWMRGTVLTGLPWNTIGYALTGSELMMQSASLVGVYALTLFAMLLFSAPAVIWAEKTMQETSRIRRFAFPVLMSGLLAASMIWGYWRLDHAQVSFVEGVNLRIVQPNIPQEEKWKPENRAAVFQRYLQVSRQETLRGGLDKISHLIWPESALPFLLAETPEALQAVSDLLPKGATFITGAARAEQRNRSPAAERQELKVYNSLFVMDDKASILSTYDKVHLVPFGEYLPFQETLESIGLSQLTRIKGGFTPGRGSRLSHAPGVPDFIALICYEIIFPDQIRERGGMPGWLLNVTNDAWFGNSAGPHQHFHQARVRGVEQGLPVVRAANNGISAVTDAYGRIIARLPRNVARALDSPLPENLSSTLFSRWGIAILPLAICLALALWYSVYKDSVHKGRSGAANL